MKNDVYVTRSSIPSYEEYCEAIKPLWDSHWLTNMGQYHQELEWKLTDYLQVPQVSLMVNGHMALELTLQSFNFPEGSEVITTPFTFISTTHAIVRNHLQPVFCDVKESDGTIDETRIEELITPRTVAILPVHVYGHICNVNAIQRIAGKYGLKVIYDAAHAFGEKVRFAGDNNEIDTPIYSEYELQSDNWIGVGIFGDASVFSFHATKVYNTIEGGAVVCKDRDLYDKLYNLKNFGIRGEELVVSVGANAKMNEFSAIMGILNLKHIDRAIEDRKRVFKRYEDLLSDLDGVEIFGSRISDLNEVQSNYAYCPILIGDEFPVNRDKLYEIFSVNGIHVRKYFYPITSDQACFKNQYKSENIETARRLSRQVLVLPIFEGMTDDQIKSVVDVMSNI